MTASLSAGSIWPLLLMISRSRPVSARRTMSISILLWMSFWSCAGSWIAVSYGICCKTKRKGMHREGDLGMEPRESYDPMPGASVEDKTILIKRNIGKACFVVENAGEILCDAGNGEASMAFKREKKATEQLTSILHIETPDQYINTLDANLVAASNGLWDGSTWLHGCIGWRMPLAGWRAAYLADVLGWNERAKTHFEAYAKSQVTNVPAIYPHPTQDSALNLARAQKKWGTQMYSNGYICPADSLQSTGPCCINLKDTCIRSTAPNGSPVASPARQRPWRSRPRRSHLPQSGR